MKRNVKQVKRMFGIVSVALMLGCGAPSTSTETPAADTTGTTAVQPAPTVEPQAGNNGPVASNTTTISFQENEFNFGKIKEGEKVTHEFKFVNSGDKPLLITGAYGNCACTVPTYPKEPIPPGGENVITVVFDSEGKQGYMHKAVTIDANTNPEITEITISGEITPK